MASYKKVLEKYIKKKYPNIRCDQHVINYNNKRHKGYSNLVIKQQFQEKLRELLESNNNYIEELQVKRIKEHDEVVFEKDNKMWDFFEKNIEYTDNKSVIQIVDIAERYENKIIENKKIVCIEHKYKIQFEKYIRIKYPDVKFLHDNVNIGKKKTNGWYNFKLKEIN